MISNLNDWGSVPENGTLAHNARYHTWGVSRLWKLRTVSESD
jgi:hypothetical protein